ncbi:YsnF/AvaK domain-containing protein [Cereibacter sp. SYSU M97828]|nr:YsnF/AvaK domain-containing protein [Cereibacter flavus]
MSEAPKPNVLPLIEERAELTKEPRLTGRVRVSTETKTVEEFVPVELGTAQVDVVRVPVGRTIDAAPEVRIEGDLTIIPVVEERVVVTRELYLLEEIHVRRVYRTETENIPVTLRRQTVRIERSSPEKGDDTGSTKYKDDQNEL